MCPLMLLLTCTEPRMMNHHCRWRAALRAGMKLRPMHVHALARCWIQLVRAADLTRDPDVLHVAPKVVHCVDTSTFWEVRQLSVVENRYRNCIAQGRNAPGCRASRPCCHGRAHRLAWARSESRRDGLQLR